MTAAAAAVIRRSDSATASTARTVAAVIAGPRTLRQWQDYLPAVDFCLSAEDEALVDSLVPSGHPSTPGFTNPAYPLHGRIAKTGV